jgi:hypothetical protein
MTNEAEAEVIRKLYDFVTKTEDEYSKVPLVYLTEIPTGKIVLPDGVSTDDIKLKVKEDLMEEWAHPESAIHFRLQFNAASDGVLTKPEEEFAIKMGVLSREDWGVKLDREKLQSMFVSAFPNTNKIQQPHQQQQAGAGVQR